MIGAIVELLALLGGVVLTGAVCLGFMRIADWGDRRRRARAANRYLASRGRVW